MPIIKTGLKNHKRRTQLTRKLYLASLAVGLSLILAPASALAAGPPADVCGGDPSVAVSIDFGCKGAGNPIIDLTFAIVRFLSIGVGIIVVASLIVAGIQYTSSSGDPQAAAKALKRISNTVAALVLYIFIFAIINWLVPAALLK